VQGFRKYVRARDLKPIVVGFLAARVLQDGVVPNWRDTRAVTSMEKLAKRQYVHANVTAVDLRRMAGLYKQTTYWHGTGRYQWGSDGRVDVLAAMLQQKAITPFPDKYDARLGTRPVVTASFATVRLYARCYADMHHQNPTALNRYIDASHAISFFIVRPYARYRYKQARSHPDGLWAGRAAQRKGDQVRLAQVGRHWTAKLRKEAVNPMLAFRAGSDIPGNYGVVFGLDAAVALDTSHDAFTETKEVRANTAVPLQHVTHIEVPSDNCEAVEKLVREHNLHIPVIATETMEAYVATLPITTVLGLEK
jgi:hypothetical protein